MNEIFDNKDLYSINDKIWNYVIKIIDDIF